MANFLDSVVYKPVRLFPAEKQYIEEAVMGAFFPWYYVNSQTFDNSVPNIPEPARATIQYENAPYLSHTLLARSENESVTNLTRPATDFSSYYEFFIEIFHRFMKDNNLSYKKIYRANLNLNWHNGYLHTEPHFDHEWAHCNFIMYLNTCQNGQTIVWPADFSASYMIPCKQYYATTFNAQWHAHRFPAPRERRVVFIVTYI